VTCFWLSFKMLKDINLLGVMQFWNVYLWQYRAAWYSVAAGISHSFLSWVSLIKIIKTFCFSLIHFNYCCFVCTADPSGREVESRRGHEIFAFCECNGCLWRSLLRPISHPDRTLSSVLWLTVCDFQTSTTMRPKPLGAAVEQCVHHVSPQESPLCPAF
jgi:hypothetical protein